MLFKYAKYMEASCNSILLGYCYVLCNSLFKNGFKLLPPFHTLNYHFVKEYWRGINVKNMKPKNIGCVLIVGSNPIASKLWTCILIENTQNMEKNSFSAKLVAKASYLRLLSKIIQCIIVPRIQDLKAETRKLYLNHN